MFTSPRVLNTDESSNVAEVSQCAGDGGGAALAAGVPGLPGLGGAAAAGAGRHQAPAGHRAGGCQGGEGDSRPDTAQAGGAVLDWNVKTSIDNIRPQPNKQ